ncbi:hypothetical protein EON77_05590 [bacterium]|nr:MAG: hypothetical protein EON77_05590 [bacterium]
MARKYSALVAPLLILSILGSVATLSGCGGGGGGSHDDGGVIANPMGRVHINVTWPISKSRAIPTNAHSIKLEMKDGATVAMTSMIVSPATSTTMADVPVGTWTLRATAYESTDCTGVAIASADSPVIVIDGGTASVSLTLASTIDHLEYSPNPFIVGVGTSLPLIVTAKDTAGNSVMVDRGALTFSVSNPGLFTIDSTGKVTAGLGLGLGTITVNEANSGKSLTIAAQVALGIIITPPISSVNVNGRTNFSALVLGSLNPSVTWSVREANGGTIAADGTYTAPSHRGTYHIDATSVADPTRTSTAIVSVTAGSVNAEVH